MRARPFPDFTSFNPGYRLDAAAANKWVVIDMKNDWKRIFASE